MNNLTKILISSTLVLISSSSFAHMDDSTMLRGNLALGVQQNRNESETSPKELPKPKWFTVYNGNTHSYNYNADLGKILKLRYSINAGNGGTFTINSKSSFSKGFKDREFKNSRRGKRDCWAEAIANGTVKYSSGRFKFTGGKDEDKSSQVTATCHAIAEVSLSKLEVYGYK